MLRSRVLIPAHPATFRGSLNADPNCRAEKTDTRPDEDRLRGRTPRRFQRVLAAWTDPSIWRAASIETIATTSLTYLTSLSAGTFIQFGKYAPNWVGVTNIFSIGLFILANAVTTGGHLNPLISFSTMLTGLTPIPRAVLYIFGQTIAGLIAGGLIRVTYGKELGGRNLGCEFDPYAPGGMSRGQAFLIEAMACFILLQLAYGCALDPRTSKTIGPVLGPICVCLTFGLLTFATSGISSNYDGASMNPSRCFAFGVATGDYSNQWLYWAAPAAGAVLMALAYHLAPVYRSEVIVVPEDGA